MSQASVPFVPLLRGLSIIAKVLASTLLLPIFGLAVAPLLLFLMPVAIIALPFAIPTLLLSWQATRNRDRASRASLPRIASADPLALVCVQRNEVE